MTSFVTPNLPELLAPAGTREAFLAAIAAGADGVYLGLDRFNARRGAHNFTLDELPDLCVIAHENNTKVYLTVNVVFTAAEMNDAFDMVVAAWDAGIDAVIVQDLGLIEALHTQVPYIRVHASTQMNIHDAQGIRVLAELGVKRVTLARELSLNELAVLAAVAHDLSLEIESFAHGALCVCASGQCLLSSMIGGRSANRGQCAQPCRLPYTLVDKQDDEAVTPGPHLLSPKDLASIEYLDALRDARVDSLKIEGRMKSPEYVYSVVSTYRKALDGTLEGTMEETYATLAEAFSRGFTPGYLIGENGNDLMSYAKPNNRGIPVGRLTSVEGLRATIRLDKALFSGDTIDIWTGKGRFAQSVGPMELDGTFVELAPAGSTVVIELEKRAHKTDRVFRVRSAALAAKTADAVANIENTGISLGCKARVVVGEPCTVTLTRGDETVTATGPVVESARTKALTQTDVMEHLNRLGGTRFNFDSIEVEMGDAPAGMGFSTLHKLRRAACDLFTEKYLGGHANTDGLAYEPSLPALVKRKRAKDGIEHVDLVAVVATSGAGRAALNAGADYALVPAEELAEEEPREGIIPLLPRLCHDNEFDTMLGIAERYGRAVCATLGQLFVAKARGIEASAHWALNATNPYTIEALGSMGASLVWLSPELSEQQIKAVTARTSVPTGIAVAGLTEVMTTEHCVLMALGPCGRNCLTCERRQQPYALKDRKGYHFRTITDVNGRSHIYNAVPLDLTDVLDEVLGTGINAVRVDLSTALTSSVSGEIARVKHALIDTLAGRPVEKPTFTLTRGAFYRGLS